jgi:NTP pyrophosphatase (non-canonical NTP hydrolase)
MSYWDRVCELNEKQERKGLKKYGQSLEDNKTLSTDQRIEHLEEELIDALKYCEHLRVSARDILTANDYQRQAMRTAGDDRSQFLDNAIMGLCGEVGECADIVKKHRFQGHDLDVMKLIDELSDVCWYVALLATALDVSLENVMIHNIAKLKRRYPDGFSKERSINRSDIDIGGRDES